MKSSHTRFALIVTAVIIVGLAFTAWRWNVSLHENAHSYAGQVQKAELESSTSVVKVPTDEGESAERVKRLVDNLNRGANRGDATSAKRLFDLYVNCYAYFGTLERIDDGRTADVLDGEIPKSLKAMQVFEKELELERDAISRARTLVSVCERVQPTYDPEAIYKSALKAAELGDGEAAMCFASSAFTIPDNLPLSDALINDYKMKAPLLIQREFMRGDWRAIVLLEGIYAPQTIAFDFALTIRAPDALEAYKYSRLRALVSDPESSAKIFSSLAAEAKQFSDENVAKADAWSLAMKAAYFSNVQNVDFSSGVQLCSYGSTASGTLE